MGDSFGFGGFFITWLPKLIKELITYSNCWELHLIGLECKQPLLFDTKVQIKSGSSVKSFWSIVWNFYYFSSEVYVRHGDVVVHTIT